MSDLEQLNSPTTKKLVGTIIFPFLVTFVMARLAVYLVLGHLFPNLFLTIKGVHIHHFTYGVVILVLDTLYLILRHPKPTSRAFLQATVFYGIGLGLTFDEFGMWIRLEDNYWVRQSYDAIIIITLMLLNIAYWQNVKNLIKKEVSWIYRFVRHLINKSQR